jgi:hypothetical protein
LDFIFILFFVEKMLFLQKSSINAKFILGGLPSITKLKNWGKKPLVLAYE